METRMLVVGADRAWRVMEKPSGDGGGEPALPSFHPHLMPSGKAGNKGGRKAGWLGEECVAWERPEKYHSEHASPGPRRRQRDLEKTKVRAKNSERKGRGEGLGGSGKHSQRRENSERLKHVRALQRTQILLPGLRPTCDFKFPSAA